MFYKQRVLANFWGRKDSAICASRKRSGACYSAVHMKWAINSLFMPTGWIFDLKSLLRRAQDDLIRINKIKYQMLAKIQSART